MQSFLEQVRQFWSELGTNQRISILFAFGGVIVGMIALLAWSGRPQYQLLYGGLDSQDMGEVVAVVEEAGVDYELSPSGNSIKVPRDQVHRLRMTLAEQGLPSGGGVGFEIFDRGNFGISDFVQRTNYLRAVQGELSRTISQLQSVRSSRVMIVLPENRLLVTNEIARPTASVFVETRGNMLDTEAVNSIRHLVANAVEGLQLNDVAVVDDRGNVLSEELQQDDMIGEASGQFKYRQDLESYFSRQIETMLLPVVGPGNVVARVSVDVDPQASTHLEERYDPESAVLRSSSATESNSETTESRVGTGVVGAAGNAPDAMNMGGNDVVSTSTDTSKDRTQSYEINRTTTETVTAPGSIRRMSAAVFVAERTETDATTGEVTGTPRTADELERIRQMVINTLGLAVESDPSLVQAVTIEEMPFVSMEPMVAGPVPEAVLHYVELGRNFVAVGIAVIMFLVFLRMLKRHRPATLSLEVLHEQNQRKAQEAQDVTPRLTPALLNELIKEKPENVSEALRGWVVGEENKKH